MMNTILTASGIPYRQGRYLNPPTGTYAVYFDNLTADGPDPVVAGAPMVIQHDCIIELYEPSPDPEAEAAMEAAINAHGYAWTKQDRYWLRDAQRYQVVYELTYFEKRRT